MVVVGGREGDEGRRRFRLRSIKREELDIPQLEGSRSRLEKRDLRTHANEGDVGRDEE